MHTTAMVFLLWCGIDEILMSELFIRNARPPLGLPFPNGLVAWVSMTEKLEKLGGNFGGELVCQVSSKPSAAVSVRGVDSWGGR